MSYQYVGEDEETFKVKHPDGSEFTIAKSAVGPEVHKRIKGLKPIKMADGGFVPDFENEYPGSSKEKTDKETIEESEVQKNPMKEYSNLVEHYKGLGVGGLGGSPESRAESDYNALLALRSSKPESLSVNNSARLRDLESITAGSQDRAPAVVGPSGPTIPPVLAEQAPVLSQPEMAVQPVQPQVQQALPTVSASDPYAQAISATKNEMAVNNRETLKQNNILAKLDEQQKAADVALAKEIAPIQQQNLELEKAMREQKIDPQKMWHESSTGNKIIAAIGIALSGMGSGLTGQKNMALEIIDKSIDRDIDAQKSELGKKETLYSMNLKKLGNAQAAAAATRTQLLSSAKLGVESSMNLTKNANDLQRGAVLLGELGEKQKKSDKDAGANLLRQKIYSGQIPVTDANINMLPEEDRKRFVKIGGKYVPAPDENRQKEATKIVGANDAMMSNLDQLISLRDKYGSETLPGPVKAEMQTIAANLQLSIKEAKQLGTLDKGAEKFMEKLVADPTSFGYVSDQYKALKSTQLREATQRLKSLGVDASSLESQNAEVKTMGGKQYKKVPGGWQPI